MSSGRERVGGGAVSSGRERVGGGVSMRLVGGALVAEFGEPRRCLSSAVLGGGLTDARSWLNVTVAPDYSRTDPDTDLAERAAALGLPGPMIGMLTAVDVARHERATRGCATAIATVGVRHGLAAAGRRPRSVPAAGTINLLVLVDAALTDAALTGAVQTAVEAKAQALADAGVSAANAPGTATGTATDSICIAARPGATVPFAGPATRAGADIAQAVHTTVLAGAIADESRGQLSSFTPAPALSVKNERSELTPSFRRGA